MDYNKLSQAIEHCYNNLVNKNGDIFIVSISAYEKYICLLDLILNITYHFRNFNVKILISLKNNLDLNINFEHVFIHRIDNASISAWGTIHYFDQHYCARNYCITNNINYKYFCLCISNQLFLKDITMDLLNEYCVSTNRNKITISNEEKTKFIKYFLKTDKWWYPTIRQNQYFVDFVKNNNFVISESMHEGLIFDKNAFEFICETYEKFDFVHNLPYGINFEEIFPLSLIRNHYDFPYIVPCIFHTVIYEELLDIIKTQPGKYAVKIKRDLEHPLRRTLRNNIFNALQLENI
jgi:hypothetical protein